MSDEQRRDQDQELARRIQELPLLRPEAGYRERVRRQFTGETPAEPLPLPAPSSRRGLLWGGIGLVAAVLAVILMVNPGLPPVWEVLDSAGAVHITVDGDQIAMRDAVGMQLGPGSRVVGCPRGEIILGMPSGVTFVLAPEAEVSVGTESPLLGATRLTAEVFDGVTFGTTGTDLPSGGFRIRTAGAEIKVSGTTFSVSSGADTTCICVLEGKVEVTNTADGSVRRLPPRSRLYVAHHRAEARLEDLPDLQIAKLTEIRNRGLYPEGAHRL